jgi:hypothetical protein
MTELELIRNHTFSLSKIYQPLSLSGRHTFDKEFLQLVTSNLDIMTDEIYDTIFEVVRY